VDRYLAWPGQALAYKLGQVELLDLRRRAGQHLGGRFDVRRFHDIVLGHGSVPLAVVRTIVEGQLASTEAGRGRRRRQRHSDPVSWEVCRRCALPLGDGPLSSR
jgi:hypothetical protein